MSTPQGTGLVFISSALFPFLYGLKIHRIKNKYNFLKGGGGGYRAGRVPGLFADSFSSFRDSKNTVIITLINMAAHSHLDRGVDTKYNHPL